jgi:hypothetical protein
VTLSLVIANAISISVRERRPELAVMKVLGFRPMQILWLVLGESLLLGAGAGFASAGLTYGVLRPVLHPRRCLVVGHGHRGNRRSGGELPAGLGCKERQAG